ncbi:MAG TPA: 3-deoxy-7-phosphoheptulonate synthase [Anaerovibrio sp.]|uniref:3-deoxy-7-phosphoheptulonate synthase n=1 Tax=Anaerovibrio lipolyticus TaxID=82374 RepID=UPI000E905703|nr:3-deoxy-7-phosphoheptulonate synthase [Anaerovibrio lipolyticus]MBE6106573.1 3-deoxy-7-phosphoheptulonate synthase [Anaerovibrio lipolyticus]HAF32227.1 3-deoxy-7-phosphoheptulonate synthase [Anaerovibrio sp.]HAQ55428.1 3-deoxy-7-phosphoheptulonate synthase [Anaerovibrio sp.]HCP95955.1 3-deoxy-7-phosphoheptulonate synthase [Anaerovibrio sp.]
MVIIMRAGADESSIQEVIKAIEYNGLSGKVMEGEFQTIIGVIGDREKMCCLNVESLEGVEKAVSISKSYKLVSREYHPQPTVIDIGGIKIGDGNLVAIAGPCAVESKEQIMQAADIVKSGGAQFLRGGAYKPRTSPYSFQGLEELGLKYLAEAGERTGLKIVSEVTEVENVDKVAEYVDVLQIGARNMQNFRLLKEVGRQNKPVLLKRGISATIDEWLNAAEYIMSEGNERIILCERGIRSYEEYTRNTLDLSAVAAVKHLSHLPIIVDPSHGTGKWRMVKPMAFAAVAAGADGLMMEMHPDPAKALSDGPQSLTPEHYRDIMDGVSRLAAFLQESGLAIRDIG